MNWWQALAARADVPVYAAIGSRMLHRVDELFLQPRVTRVATPRAAAVLLVAGALRDADADALRRVHDQIPHPRATLWWLSRPVVEAGGTPECAEADEAGAVALQLRHLHERLQRTPESTEPDWLPDRPPSPWRDVGEHGQGGEGMMGGTPHGRPMAMTAEDLRDGLQLDAFTLRIGPFAPHLPPGLVLQLKLQGDVVQEATVCAAPHVQQEEACGPVAASQQAVRVLELLELPALAQSCRQHARSGEPETLVALQRRLRRCGVLAAIPPGLGSVTADGPDVRERLQASLRGEAPADQPGTDLPTMLRGLEWQEAMLVVASLAPSAFTGAGAP